MDNSVTAAGRVHGSFRPALEVFRPFVETRATGPTPRRGQAGDEQFTLVSRKKDLRNHPDYAHTTVSVLRMRSSAHPF